WEFYVGHERNVVVNDINCAEKLCKPSKRIYKRLPFPTLERIGLGHGLFFNNNYESFHKKRRLVNRALGAQKFIRGFVISIQNIFKESEDIWKKLNVKNGIEFDFCEWIRCYLTDISILQTTKQRAYTVASFGAKDNLIQTKEVKNSLRFTDAVDKFFDSLGFFAFIPLFMQDYVPGFTHYRKRCERNVHYLYGAIVDIINKRKKELDEGAELDADLLDHFLIAHTLKDHGSDKVENLTSLTTEEVCVLTWDTLLAGTEATGNALCFLIYFVAKNPNVLAKIHKEIDEVFGSDPNVDFALEKLDNCHYIDAVVKESLRLILVSPYTVKISDETENIGGYDFPSGTKFWVDHQGLCNNPDIWNNPETFNPDRFLTKNHGGSSEVSELQKFAFTPFGCGLRGCAGKTIAPIMMKTVVVILYRKYNIELVKKDEMIKYYFTAMHKVYDLNVKVSLRDVSSFS
ncbi:4505_t:CDS:2, partial [Racocetra persica]